MLFACAGVFSGMVAPSRDMMVRAVTPPAPSGKVFGFVTTGFNIGGIAGPLLFGLVLDLGDAAHLFWTIAALSLLTLVVVYATAPHRRAGSRAGALILSRGRQPRPDRRAGWPRANLIACCGS